MPNGTQSCNQVFTLELSYLEATAFSRQGHPAGFRQQVFHHLRITLEGVGLKLPLARVLGQQGRGCHHMLEVALLAQMVQEEPIDLASRKAGTGAQSLSQAQGRGGLQSIKAVLNDVHQLVLNHLGPLDWIAPQLWAQAKQIRPHVVSGQLLGPHTVGLLHHYHPKRPHLLKQGQARCQGGLGCAAQQGDQQTATAGNNSQGRSQESLGIVACETGSGALRRPRRLAAAASSGAPAALQLLQPGSGLTTTPMPLGTQRHQGKPPLGQGTDSGDRHDGRARPRQLRSSCTARLDHTDHQTKKKRGRSTKTSLNKLRKP